METPGRGMASGSISAFSAGLVAIHEAHPTIHEAHPTALMEEERQRNKELQRDATHYFTVGRYTISGLRAEGIMP